MRHYEREEFLGKLSEIMSLRESISNKQAQIEKIDKKMGNENQSSSTTPPPPRLWDLPLYTCFFPPIAAIIVGGIATAILGSTVGTVIGIIAIVLSVVVDVLIVIAKISDKVKSKGYEKAKANKFKAVGGKKSSSSVWIRRETFREDIRLAGLSIIKLCDEIGIPPEFRDAEHLKELNALLSSDTRSEITVNTWMSDACTKLKKQDERKAKESREWEERRRKQEEWDNQSEYYKAQYNKYMDLYMGTPGKTERERDAEIKKILDDVEDSIDASGKSYGDY